MNPYSNIQPIIISGSTRSDGTKRPDVKIKPGYIRQELVPAYVIPQKQVSLFEIANGSKLLQAQNEQKQKEDLQPNYYNKKQGKLEPKDKIPPIMEHEQSKESEDQEGEKKIKKRIRRKKGDTEIAGSQEESKQKELKKPEVSKEKVIENTEKVIDNVEKVIEKVEEKVIEKVEDKAKIVVDEKETKKVDRRMSNISKQSNEEGELNELTEKKHKLRNLKKKLKGIEILEEKKRNGNILNADEFKKLNSKKETLIQIHDLTISLKDK